ncbi:hypothetical protein AAG906_019969 [Vitis piasezkii]
MEKLDGYANPNSILTSIWEDMVDSQSLIILESLVSNFVFNKSLSRRFVVSSTFIDIF